MPEKQQAQKSTESKSNTQTRTIPPKQMPISHPASIIQRARMNPKSLTPADVLQLQRTIGNKAVGRLLSEIWAIPSKTKQSPPVQRQELVQRQEIPEEGPLHGKMIGTVQRQEIPEEEPLQTKSENNTGMPNNLKTGVESLSGIDMSDVKVHYNSSKPADVGALAYTQGTNIHVAPGQEKHLPHEAWHVVQQMQGRVKPTIQAKGVPVNDDAALECEADVMGTKAFQMMISDQAMIDEIPHQHSVLETTKVQTAHDTCFSVSARHGSPDADCPREAVQRRRDFEGEGQIHGRFATNSLGKGKSVFEFPIHQKASRLTVLATLSQGTTVQKKATIQRNVYLTVNAGNIEQVVATRDNEMGIMGVNPGDHTTAHIVFRDMIRNQLLDQPLALAPAILRQLYESIWDMPGIGNFEHVPGQFEANFDNADDIAQGALNAAEHNASIANVQAAAQAIMNLRNSVPLSAFMWGGAGSGEGPQAARLNGAEHALRANMDLDIEQMLNIAPFNGDGTVAKQIRTAVFRLLDTGRIAQDSEGDVDPETTPGLSGDYESDRRDLADQHLQTIALAYPTLWAIVLAPQEAALRQGLIDQMEIGNYRDEEYEDESELELEEECRRPAKKRAFLSP